MNRLFEKSVLALQTEPAPISAGFALWFTGLSAAGKSTLVRAVAARLSALGVEHEVLDADDLRKDLNRDLGFTREDRNENIRRIAYVASLLVRHNVVVLVAAVSPFRAARDLARQRIGAFAEVHVDAPLNVCEARDPIGLYRRLRSGQINLVAGADAPYEPPLTPELRLETHRESVDECVDRVMALLSETMRQQIERSVPR
jgi:adenylyl-sulfate kinase